MKIFANKNIWKKIVIILLFITVLAFVVPEPVSASFGGELMTPICSFLVGIADGVMDILHSMVLEQDTTIIDIDLTSGNLLRDILIVVGLVLTLVALVAVGGAVAAGTAVLAVVGTAIKVVGTIAVGSVLLGSVCAVYDIASSDDDANELDNVNLIDGYSYFEFEWFEDEIVLPIYNMSPEEIFRNTVNLFDVNFFSDENKETTSYDTVSTIASPTNTLSWSYSGGTYGKTSDAFYNEYGIQAFAPWEINECIWDDYTPLATYSGETLVEWGLWDYDVFEYYLENATVNNITSVAWYSVEGVRLYQFTYSGTTYYTILAVAKKIEGETAKYSYYAWVWTENPEESITTEIVPDTDYSISYYLQEIVQKWYYVLLTLAAVGMLSVLVYIGIRILLASASKDKAKYKQMLGDWFVGMVLLFSMHYIMTFANTFTDLLTDFVNEGDIGIYTLLIEDDDDEGNGKIATTLADKGWTAVPIDSTDDISYLSDKDQADIEEEFYIINGQENADGKSVSVIVWNTNMMGYLRVCLQASASNGAAYLGYTIMFIMMVAYTIFFMWTYIKRVILMAFLTIIAPLVALTYPIDKVNDGQAQGFNVWFKEYMFNLLLQPVHLLLYTIIVSSAIELALYNPLYGIVALGFMTTAEKILRQIFNFSKAQTPGALAGATGTALAMTGMQWLMGKGPRGGKGGSGGHGGSGSGSGDTETDSSGKIYTPSGGEHATSVADIATGTTTSSLGDGSRQNKGKQGVTEALEDTKNNWSETKNNLKKTELGQKATKAYNDFKGTKFGGKVTDLATNAKKTVRGFKGSLSGTGAISYLDAYGNGMKKKLKRNIKNAKPLKTMAKAAGGIVAGATLGTVGLALGAASGDPSNALKYTTATIAGGAKLGSGAVGSVQNALDGDVPKDTAKRAMMGEEEYQKAMAEKNKKEAKQNEQYIRMIQEKFKVDRMTAKEELSEMVDFGYDNKITDMNNLITIEKAARKIKDSKEEGHEIDMERARQEAFAGWHLENQYHASSRIGKEERGKLREQIAKDYGYDVDAPEVTEMIRMVDDVNMATNNK